MNLFARLSELIAVSMHASLNRVENPELMLAHLLLEMEEGLASASQEAAKAIAVEKRLRRELDQLRGAAAYWQEQAHFALAQGREDLARRALAHKIDHDALVSGLEVQHRAAHQVGMEVKEALQTMRRRLDEARRRQSLLLVRRRTAEVRLDAERWFSHDMSKRGDAFSRFELLERRLAEGVDDLLAQIEVNRVDGGLETELVNLERDRRLEEEWNEMKRQAGSTRE